MKQFHAITETSIAKLKIVGINADQLDQLVESSTLECNAIAELLHTSHHMVSNNQESEHLLCIPKEQLQIVSDAIKYYRENAPIDEHAHFDTYSLEQLFSGDYRVDVNLTDNNSQFGLKSGVDIPEFVDDDEPTGSCLNARCRKYLYNGGEFCDDNCENEPVYATGVVELPKRTYDNQ
tara:strand:- start:553 stop:1086 length:534 start_codon:yes stop_codon:yes gene_type:complete